jgi:hypothetical protein
MDAQDVIQPGASGMEGLRGVGLLAKRVRVGPIVVMDNVHTVMAGTIQKIETALAYCRIVLLAQPAPFATELEELLGITAVALNGWSLLAIAAEFELAHAPVDPVTG